MLLVDRTGELGFGNARMGLALKCDDTLGRSFSQFSNCGRTEDRYSVAREKGTCLVGKEGGQDLRSNSWVTVCYFKATT